MNLRQKNKKILFFTFFLIFLIFFPFKIKSQGIFGWIAGMVATPIYFALGVILLIFLWLSGLLVSFITFLLDFVTSDKFISFSYTRPCPLPPQTPTPGCNPIIGVGLPIVQGFVNIGLIVALIIIALSIALRIGEYGSKKLFFKLIVVALLVNFVPVICGLAVDASNIVMNYFLTGIKHTAGGVFHNWQGVWRETASFFKNILSDLEEKIEEILKISVFIFFNFITIFVFFIFVMIFVFRYIAIWILVILAPLAFVFSILPLTKRFWNMWLNQFFQWLIVGIPLAFFLYLGMSSFGALSETFHSMADINPSFAWFDATLPYLTIVCILLFGLMVGLQTSAMGANTVIGFGKQTLQRGGEFAKRGMRAGASRIFGAKGREAGEKIATLTSRDLFGKFGKTGIGRVVTAPVMWAVRGTGRGLQAVYKGQEKDIEKAKEGLKDADISKLASIITGVGIAPDKKIAALTEAIERGKIGDLRKYGVTDDDIIKVGQSAMRINPDKYKSIIQATPHLAVNITKDLSQTEKEKLGVVLTQNEIKQGITVPMKIMMKIKPEFIPKIDEEALLNPEVQTFFHHYATVAQVQSLLTSGPIKARQLYIAQVMENKIDYYEQYRPDLANFFKSNPGIRLLGGPVPRRKIVTP